ELLPMVTSVGEFFTDVTDVIQGDDEKVDGLTWRLWNAIEWSMAGALIFLLLSLLLAWGRRQQRSFTWVPPQPQMLS
ncbi:unnamed protein product, partial [Durusdinium trenchii]